MPEVRSWGFSYLQSKSVVLGNLGACPGPLKKVAVGDSIYIYIYSFILYIYVYHYIIYIYIYIYIYIAHPSYADFKTDRQQTARHWSIIDSGLAVIIGYQAHILRPGEPKTLISGMCLNIP